MRNELVIPNFHVILVHYPLGLLVVGTVIELLAFLWRQSPVRAAARWMILIGAMSAVPAALSGLYALHDVATRHMDPSTADEPWAVVAAQSPLTPGAWTNLTRHLQLEAIAAIASMLVVVIWIACSERWRRRLHVPLLLILLAGIGLAGVGAWYAGEAVYADGVGVGRVEQSANDTTRPTTETTSFDIDQVSAMARYVSPPLQTHVVLAGFTFAIALVSVGLSFHKLTQTRQSDRDLGDLASVLSARMALPNLPPAGSRTAPPATPRVQPDELPAVEFIPVARFWVVACAVGLLTALTGVWFLSVDSSMVRPMELWNLVYRDSPGKRRLVHVLTGTAVAMLPLGMALLVRFLPRQRVLLALLTLVLVGAIATQAWLGVLLLFDTPQGPLNHWNPASVAVK